MGVFYRISQRRDGLVDIWLTPGEATLIWGTDGRADTVVKVKAVHGIDPKDPQWGGDLEEHIRRHYYDWLEMAEEIEI